MNADLIERLEAATDGNRELDVLIGACIDFRSEYCPISVGKYVADFGMEWMINAALNHQNIWQNALPRYTTSLDAALTLVPEARIWTIGTYTDHSGYWACLDNQVENTKAATSALALCIAALKAIHDPRSANNGD